MTLWLSERLREIARQAEKSRRIYIAGQLFKLADDLQEQCDIEAIVMGDVEAGEPMALGRSGDDKETAAVVEPPFPLAVSTRERISA